MRLCSRLRGGLRALIAQNHIGNEYAHKVKQDHRRHEDEHRLRVWSGRDDRCNHRDQKYRIAEIFEQEFRRDDAEDGQYEYQRWEFEDHSQANQHDQDQIEIFVDADEWFHWPIIRETDEESEHLRQKDEIAEGDAAEEQEHRRDDESRGGTALMLVEAGRNEHPDLVQHVGHRDCNSKVQAEINV